MMTKEEYELAVALRSQGLSIQDIAGRLSFHPATISKWLRAEGPPQTRAGGATDQVIDPRWERRIAALLAAEPHIAAAKVHRALATEGFSGSYPSVTRHLRTVRGPRSSGLRQRPREDKGA